MPLNKHQQTRSEMTTSAADYTISKHHQRTAGLDLVDGDRPATPQNRPDKRSRSQTGHENTNGAGHAQIVGGKHSLDPGITDFEANTAGNGKFNGYNGHKLNVPNTMVPPKSRNQDTSASNYGKTQFKHQKPPASRREQNHKVSTRQTSRAVTATNRVKETHKVSAFDDTTSIGPSMLEDSSIDENPTIVFNPQLQSAAQRRHEPQDPYQNSYSGNHNEGKYDTQAILEQLNMGDDWEDQVVAERAYQAERTGYVPTPQRGTNPFTYNLMKGQTSGVLPAELLEQPETPSRVRSVPPDHTKVHAPVPKRTVGFVNSPQIMGGVSDSPLFRSEELAKEHSPASSISRPNSAFVLSHSMPLHQRAQSIQPRSHTHQQPSQPSNVLQPPRFQNMQIHRERMVQQEQKISAPESDKQDTSEDEQAIRTQPGNPPTGLKQVNDIPATSKKRQFEDANLLDYDADALSKKTLSALRKESYTQDPRAQSQSPTRDVHGTELRLLPQVLDNLSRVAPEQQRATFSTLSDEEWAQTGEWFVEKFQTDLKKLMEVRLKRRQIALTFEDKIRRRQRQVEYQQAGVEKQLAELQEGGLGLLKDRPVVSGSRGTTPLRTPRR